MRYRSGRENAHISEAKDRPFFEGLAGFPLYYCKREDSTLEEDFFLRSASSLIPVEVKATSGRSKSMRTLIDSVHYPDIRYGFKLSMNNIDHENRIYTFPYFCTFLLKRFMKNFRPEEEKDMICGTK